MTFPITDNSAVCSTATKRTSLLVLITEACDRGNHRCIPFMKEPIMRTEFLCIWRHYVMSVLGVGSVSEIWLQIRNHNDIFHVFFFHICSSRESLKRKCRHFDEILITGCTGSCHFDNFQCSQWWKFHQNEDISVSVICCLFNTYDVLL